ncbi:unnamed protein product [Brassica oleracea var. botrytis]|uniref:BnaC05g16150D protein n=2 Tax=Brassica TaxID=3705 RepID=A0A078H166_BRANA|nr:BnaC05g16150D [Brassica napus]VDD43103.1 unnamed protein product [Brassica oleracea]
MSPCKRKNEEEAVAAVCLISKAPEGISLDIPQRKEKDEQDLQTHARERNMMKKKPMLLMLLAESSSVKPQKDLGRS